METFNSVTTVNTTSSSSFIVACLSLPLPSNCLQSHYVAKALYNCLFCGRCLASVLHATLHIKLHHMQEVVILMKITYQTVHTCGTCAYDELCLVEIRDVTVCWGATILY